MKLHRSWLPILAGLLVGCATTRSLTGPSATPAVSPPVPAASSPAPAAALPGTGVGTITPAMASLGLSPEPYATLGDPAAPITMIEFSDYGCPFCRLYASTTFPELKQRYIDTGQVFYVFKDMPIVELHPHAPLAAEAAECAGAQGRYWEMHERLFARADDWSASAEAASAAFQRYAAELELDTSAFTRCLHEGHARENVQRNMGEALGFGFSGTPTFIIDDTLINGAQSTEVFVGMLERKLEGQKER